nr:MFS transporter [Kibdelosporangium sp. MJ126-NF4]CTQ90739.1 Major facilitator superfamily MFS_1 [Kibdelosporangium sp. MJ126-NF4]
MNPLGPIAACYGLTGLLSALWGATLPATDARLDLGAGRLGAVLLVLAAGSLVAMPVAGRLAERWTTRPLLRACVPATALAVAGPGLAPSAGWLAVAAGVLGLLLGTLNVALSVRTVAVEQAAARPVMATMHGTWTLGAVGGGAGVTMALRAGVDVQALMTCGAVALAALGLAVGWRLEPLSVAPRATDPVGPPPRQGLVLLLGVLGAAAFIAEGAATDWAGVHATRVLGADPATGSLVFTAFFGAMTVVRFAGDALRARFGAAVTIRLAGAVATAGWALVLLGPTVGFAITGWTLTGAGMALVWPIVISAVGAATRAARQLSTVTTVSYGGGLIGPALIGYVATRASLPVALLIPAALALVVATAAPAVLNALTQKSHV